MRILQVIDTLNIGGAERVFVDMCNILHDYNQDVSALLLLKDKGPLAIDLRVPVKTLNRKNKWSVKTLYKCYNILTQYDIVHCHSRHIYKYIALVKLVFRLNSKIIFQDHYGSIEIDKKVPFLFDSLFKPKYYIGVSETLTEWAIEYLKIRANNVFLLQNIIKKRSQNSSSKLFEYLLVSNIKPVKNNLFAIELCKEMDSSLLLVGKNQENDYFHRIEKELNEKIILDSTVSDAQVIMSKSKIGLHTSSSETGPLVLIEYLAQGLPFLAYETGEVAKILKPHFPEYFIDNYEIGDWQKRLGTIYNSNPDTEKMQRIFEKYFGEGEYYNKLINIYKCILNS